MNLTRKILTTTLYAIPLFLVTASVVLAQTDPPTGLQLVLWTLVNNIFGWMAGASGVLLDLAVREYIVGFGTNFLGSGVGVAVDSLWVNTRDFFNLTFIFGLVFLGFKMILNSDDASTRKWLISLIMAALLVNFSLFITKFIVDFSNILASQIVTAAFPYSVTQGFMDAFQISTIFDGKWINNLPTGVNSEGAYAYIFGSAIMFIVTAFVFFAGAIMLFIRYTVLAVYMVLSPLMFLGWVFPQLQSVSSQYWSGFLGKAFYAPIYILMLFFASTIMGNFFGAGGSAGQQNFAASLVGSNIVQSVQATLPPFIITCIFLIAAIVVANKMGAEGAKTAISIGNNMTNRAKRGLQNGAMRVGRGAERAVTAAPRYAAKRTSYALGNKFDAQLAKMQNSQSRAARLLSNNVVVDDAARGASARLKGAKFGFAATVDENKKKKAVIDNRYENNLAIQRGLEAERELKHPSGDYNSQIFSQAANSGTGGMVDRSQLSPDELKRILEQNAAKMQSTVTNYSGKQLEEMLQQQPQQFNDIIGKLKASQFDKLMESDNLNQNTKNEIFGKRQDAIRSLVQKNGAYIGEEIAKISIKQIEILGDDFIRDNAKFFTQSQMDDVKKSDNFTEGQKGSYIGARKSGQFDMIDGADKSVYRNLFLNQDGKQRKAADIAQLAPAVLTHKNALPYINSSVMEEIYSKKTLTAEERDVLKRNVEGPGGTQSARDHLNSVLGRRNWNNPEPPAADKETPAADGSTTKSSTTPVNPHAGERYSSEAGAKRWADWEANNKG